MPYKMHPKTFQRFLIVYNMFSVFAANIVAYGDSSPLKRWVHRAQHAESMEARIQAIEHLGHHGNQSVIDYLKPLLETSVHPDQRKAILKSILNIPHHGSVLTLAAWIQVGELTLDEQFFVQPLLPPFANAIHSSSFDQALTRASTNDTKSLLWVASWVAPDRHRNIFLNLVGHSRSDLQILGLVTVGSHPHHFAQSACLVRSANTQVQRASTLCLRHHKRPRPSALDFDAFLSPQKKITARDLLDLENSSRSSSAIKTQTLSSDDDRKAKTLAYTERTLFDSSGRHEGIPQETYEHAAEWLKQQYRECILQHERRQKTKHIIVQTQLDKMFQNPAPRYTKDPLKKSTRTCIRKRLLSFNDRFSGQVSGGRYTTIMKHAFKLEAHSKQNLRFD